MNAGEIISIVGNSGEMTNGPHLHFEIIDTKSGKRLNPLLFNFPLEDDVRPTIVKLAMYDRTKSVYLQSPKYLALKKNWQSIYCRFSEGEFKQNKFRYWCNGPVYKLR